MYEIIDKVLLFLFSLTLYMFQPNTSFAIIPAIIAIFLSCIFIYFDSVRIRLTGTTIFAFLCAFLPGYIVYLPLILYDLLHTKYQFTAVFVPLLFLANMKEYTFFFFLYTMLYLILAYLLKIKTEKFKFIKDEYNELRDKASSYSQLMEEKNRSILKNQDYEINLATLNERNRIAREIHDNIGHLLSRALLQVGALITITKDDTVKDSLLLLKDSLSEGMDDIRNSIHKMYDDSIDLYAEIEKLIKNFTFCTMKFEYDIKTPPPLIMKQSLLAIIKEAMANIMRHSNAENASIILREHPAMYQLIIQDDGTVNENQKEKILRKLNNQDNDEGMGLHNILDRIKGFHGNLNVSFEHGFKLFITIPKGKER